MTEAAENSPAIPLMLLALDPYWRTQLPRLGVLHIFADMQRYMRTNTAYVLAIDDIWDCFPSAVLDHVMHSHRPRISQRHLLWLIEKILRGHKGSLHLTGLQRLTLQPGRHGDVTPRLPGHDRAKIIPRILAIAAICR